MGFSQRCQQATYATAMPIVLGGLKQGGLAIPRNHAVMRVFLSRLGHCATFACLLHGRLPGVGPSLAIVLAYGATRAVSAASCGSHGSDCRWWTSCSVGSVVGVSCGAGWGAVVAACLGVCPTVLLLWPPRMAPAEDASAVRRFQAEWSLETLHHLRGSDLLAKIYHYQETTYSQGQSWYRWFWKRKRIGTSPGPCVR